MKFSQEGEWIVSTPFYVGSSDDVWMAQNCPHTEYAERSKKIKEGMLVVQEKCKSCVADRVKYRPATPEEIDGEKA